jgi:hypothetical protein
MPIGQPSVTPPIFVPPPVKKIVSGNSTDNELPPPIFAPVLTGIPLSDLGTEDAHSDAMADPDIPGSGFNVSTGNTVAPEVMEAMQREQQHNLTKAVVESADLPELGATIKPVSTDVVNQQVREQIQSDGRDRALEGIALRGAGKNYSMFEFLQMIELCSKMGASDLHLRAGMPPMLRHDLDMKEFSAPIFKLPTSADCLKGLVIELQRYGSMSTPRLLSIQTGGWLDFSLIYRNSSIRGNAYLEYNGLALALRFFYSKHASLGYLELESY